MYIKCENFIKFYYKNYNMEFKGKLIKIGDSIGITIPKKKAEKENYNVGDFVNADLEKI